MKLSLQITLLIAATAIAIAMFTIFWSSHLMRQALENRLSTEASFVADALGEALVTRVINGRIIPVLDTIRQTAREHSHVAYIFVTGFDGELFAHSFDNGFPQALAPQLTPTPAPLSRYRTHDGAILHIATPLIQGMDAQLHIGMNDNDVQRRIEQLSRQLIAISITIMLAALVTSLFLGRQLAKPLIRLSQQITAYGRGQSPDLDNDPPRYGDPHLANLHHAFRGMVADRKRAEALTNRLGRIIDSSLNEIYVFHVDTLRFIHVNEGARNNLGYTLDELRQLTPLDIKPDFTLEAFKTRLLPLREGLVDKLQFVTRHKRKDGTLYPVQVNLQISKREPEPVLFALILDITEQQRTAEELEQHRNHLEALVDTRTRHIRRQAQIIDQIHDAVIAMDMSGNITLWNHGAERLFGYTAQQALKQSILLLRPPDQHLELDSDIIAPLFTQEREHHRELQLSKANDERFYAHLALSLLTDDNDKPTGILAYAIDINDKKLAEQALRQQTAELLAVNKELESFSYSVSHDLRAPLRAVDGFSLALLEDYGNKLDDTAADYLQRVRRAAQHMATLIDDLLQLSRITRSELQLANVDLSHAALDIIKRFKESDPATATTIVIAPDMTAQADTRLIRIALDNLLGNAWKFTAKRNDARIEFNQFHRNSETVYVIRDNGAGFDMRFADKLFNPFQRLHNAREFEGTGIGLATVMRIINRHGGRIWAEGEVNKGAAFYFTLGNADTPNTAHPIAAEQLPVSGRIHA